MSMIQPHPEGRLSSAGALQARIPAKTHPSVIQPPPDPGYAHVLVRDNLNAPNFVIGDVLLVDMRVTEPAYDGWFVVQIGDQQVVRMVQHFPHPQGGMGFRIACLTLPDSAFVVRRDQFAVLAAVKANANIRRVG